MKLWILKDSNHAKVYYRFYRPSCGLIWTGVKDRAAVFLDYSAAQDVVDELALLKEHFSVVSYEDVL